MSDFILVGVASFVFGAALMLRFGIWAMKYVRTHHLQIQDLAVVYDVKNRPAARFCVDLAGQHFHSHVHIHPELAAALIAGMDKAKHPPTDDIHDHMMRGRPN